MHDDRYYALKFQRAYAEMFLIEKTLDEILHYFATQPERWQACKDSYFKNRDLILQAMQMIDMGLRDDLNEALQELIPEEFSGNSGDCVLLMHRVFE